MLHGSIFEKNVISCTSFANLASIYVSTPGKDDLWGVQGVVLFVLKMSIQLQVDPLPIRPHLLFVAIYNTFFAVNAQYAD